MSNDNGFEISVKDYAAQRDKTVQAVYQQMKRQENAAALEGHIILRRVGNKEVKYLDETAVSILDEASRSTPTVIVQDDLKVELEEAKGDIKVLEFELAKQEGKIQMLKDLLADKERELRALAEPQARIDALEAQNGVLSADNDALKVKVAETEKNASEALLRAQKDADRERTALHSQFEAALAAKDTAHAKELNEKDKQIQELANRTLADYLKGLFRKKGKKNEKEE